MRLFKFAKDGGHLSKVWGLFIIEWKRAFSVVLLKFEDGSREAFHSHAFNAWSWVLWGQLNEARITGTPDAGGDLIKTTFKPSLRPIFTARDNFHKVNSVGTTWVISFRGPWADTWLEYIPAENRTITLTHGRKEVLSGDQQ